MDAERPAMVLYLFPAIFSSLKDFV